MAAPAPTRPAVAIGGPLGRVRLNSPDRRGVGADDFSGARAVSGRRGDAPAAEVFPPRPLFAFPPMGLPPAPLSRCDCLRPPLRRLAESAAAPWLAMVLAVWLEKTAEVAGLPLPPPPPSPQPLAAPEPIRVILRKERRGTGPTFSPCPRRSPLPSLCPLISSATGELAPFVFALAPSTLCIDPAAATAGDRACREAFTSCGWSFCGSSRGLSPVTLLPDKVGPCAVTAIGVAALSGLPSSAGAAGLGFRRRVVIRCADRPLDVDESFDVLLWKASGRSAACLLYTSPSPRD